MKEQKFKENNKEVKRDRTGDGDFSNVKSDGLSRPKVKQRHSSQDSPNNPRFNQDKGGRSPLPNPTCTKCERKHQGRFIRLLWLWKE